MVDDQKRARLLSCRPGQARRRGSPPSSGVALSARSSPTALAQRRSMSAKIRSAASCASQPRAAQPDDLRPPVVGVGEPLDVAEPLEVGDDLADRLLRHRRPRRDRRQPRALDIDEAKDAAVSWANVGVALVAESRVQLVESALLELAEQGGERALVAVNLPALVHRVDAFTRGQRQCGLRHTSSGSLTDMVRSPDKAT